MSPPLLTMATIGNKDTLKDQISTLPFILFFTEFSRNLSIQAQGYMNSQLLSIQNQIFYENLRYLLANKWWGVQKR